MQAEHAAADGAEAAQSDGASLSGHAQQDDGHRGGRHAGRLDEDGEVASDRRRDAERQRHDGEGDGSPALTRQT